MPDLRDWRRDLGEYGSVHVRFGKGSRGRGAKTRLVPAINSMGPLLEWWMVDVRHQFGDDNMLLDTPLLPAERSLDPVTGMCPRPGDQTLRNGLNAAVARWLPQWSGRGAYTITATPIRQITAPVMSHRSGRNLSTTTPQAREPATKIPP